MHRVIEEIEENNLWRDGEFAIYKMNTHRIDEVKWSRMCLPMIYAHWEGFVVDALKVLLKYLNGLGLSHSTISTKLTVLCIGAGYNSLNGKQSFSQRVEFTEKFHTLLQQTVKFKVKIETKSNLNTNVLKELCEIYDFDFSKFSTHESKINRLVSIRNNIAHGENSYTFGRAEIEEYILTVTKAMDILLFEIKTFLEERKYLLTTS